MYEKQTSSIQRFKRAVHMARKALDDEKPQRAAMVSIARKDDDSFVILRRRMRQKN